MEVVRHFAGRIPLLGICLGHQSIGQVFGGDVVRSKQVMHGKVSMVRHEGKACFAGLGDPLAATRYHSLVVSADTLPDCLEITARTENEDGSMDEIMGIRHREQAVEGVAIPSGIHHD